MSGPAKAATSYLAQPGGLYHGTAAARPGQSRPGMRVGALRRITPRRITLSVLILSLALVGCGKKGSPQPPPDVPNTYPRPYPSE